MKKTLCSMGLGLILVMAPVARAGIVCGDVAANLQEGDLVFREIHNFIFEYVARTTMSWASHVGIAFKDQNGEWLIAESHVPRVVWTPLCKFFGADDEKVAIRRSVRPLRPEELVAIKQYADSQQGKWYEFGFNLFQDSRQFCSKLIWEAFNRNVQIDLGRRQSFGDLMNSVKGRPDERELMKFWKIYFLGSIPFDRITITPATQFTDEDLVTVYQNQEAKEFDPREMYKPGAIETDTLLSEKASMFFQDTPF